MSARGAAIARWLGTLLLLGTGLAEAFGISDEWRAAATPMQNAVIVGELVMIVAGVLGGVGVWLRRRWSVGAAAAWAAGTVLAGGLAPRAFGNAPWSATAWSAGACVLIGALVVSLARAALRLPVRADAASR